MFHDCKFFQKTISFILSLREIEVSVTYRPYGLRNTGHLEGTRCG